MPGYGVYYGEYGAHAWQQGPWSGPESSLEAILFPVAALVLLVLLASAVGGISRLGRQWRNHPHLRHPARPGLPVGSVAGGRYPPSSPVLASEAERDSALRAISHAVGEGRLDLDEAGRRIEAVLRSRHRHELAQLVGDLPPNATSRTGSRPSASRLRLALLASTVLCILVAVVAQAAAGLWELWPLAVTACAVWAARPRP